MTSKQAPATTSPATGNAEHFTCPGCGAKYRWSAQLEGKKIRCKKCDQTFWPRGDPQETFNAAVTAAGARGGFAMLAQTTSRRAATEEEELTAFHNWVLPLGALGLGLAWRAWQCIDYAGRSDSVALWQLLLLVIGEWVVVSIACAGGVLGAAIFVDMDLDKIAAAALKILSTVILMCAVAQFSSSFDRQPGDLWGMTLGVPCVLLLAFVMLAGMFRADLLEALMGSVAITVPVVAVMGALALMMQSELGQVLSFGRPT